MRLLLAEDELDLARALGRALEENGYAVDVVHDGLEAAHLGTSVEYDAILLDLMLPERDGFEVLAEVRAARATPVLILTARDGVDDRVRGLDGGADDYLVKPFELKELLARVRALIRRAAGRAVPRIEVGDVALDPAARTVTKGGVPVRLSPKEFAVAEFLLTHRGRLVTRTMLVEHVYDDAEETASNVLDVYVASLRRKLGREFVRTRRGEGYIVDA